MDVISKLLALLQNKLRTYVVEGKIFFYFSNFNTFINMKFSIINTPKLLKLFFGLEK
jgi:hypothetical protein